MVLSHFCFITYVVGPAAPGSSQQWKRKSGFWVKRLIPFYIKISIYYLECHFWCCGKMSPVTDCWSSALLLSDVWGLDTVRCSRPGAFCTRTPKVKGKVPHKKFFLKKIYTHLGSDKKSRKDSCDMSSQLQRFFTVLTSEQAVLLFWRPPHT